MLNQLFIYLSFTLFILPVFSTSLCNIPNYIIQVAQNYTEYLHLPYNVECDDTRINISDSFVVIYNEDINYDILNPSVNYFIISKSLKFYCSENIFHVHVKLRAILKAIKLFVRKGYKSAIILSDSLSDSEIGSIKDTFVYFGGTVDLIDNVFNETRLNETLNGYTSYGNVIILNLFSDKVKLSKALHYYQNYKSVYPVYLVSYYIDESFVRTNPDLVEDTHILSGYFYHNNNPENNEFLQRFDLNNIDSFDDLLFQIIIVLEFLKYIPNVFPKDKPYLIRRKFLSKSIEIAGQKIYFSPCNTFIRNTYLADVNETGQITNVVELQTNTPNYIGLIKLRESCQYIEEQKVITFGFLSTLKDILHLNFLEGISAAVDEINRNISSLNTHIILRYPPKIDAGITSTYNYLKSFNPLLLFYFIDDDHTADIIKLMNTDPDCPLIFAYGFFSGKMCNPKFFYLGLSQDIRVKYMQYLSTSESVFLLTPVTEYGKAIQTVVSDNIYIKDTISLMVFYCYPVAYDVIDVLGMMNHFLKSHTVVYIVFDGCDLQNLIFRYIRQYIDRDNKINFMNFNPECGEYNMENWGNYYISNPFINVSKDTVLYRINELILPNGGISSTLYSGYYGVYLYYNAFKAAGVSDLSTLLPIINEITVKYDNGHEFFFSDDHYFSSFLQYGKVSEDGKLELIDESPFSYISHAFYQVKLVDTISVCNWNMNENDDYTSPLTNFGILIVDDNYYLADFTLAIINDIAITKTSDSLVFSVFYYAMNTSYNRFIEMINYFYYSRSIKCVILNEEYNPIDFDIYDLSFIIISSYDENLCDDRLFYFGFSRNSILRNIIGSAYDNQINNFIYITKVSSDEVDSTDEYFRFLLSSLYADEFNYTSIHYSEVERIKDVVINTVKPTYLYIGLYVKEDFPLTKYLIEEVNYNSDLITIIHSNNLYIYFSENLQIKNHYFPVRQIQFQEWNFGSVIESFSKTVPIDFYSLYKALFYILKTVSDTYYQYSDEYIKQLSKASYRIFEGEIKSYVINHKFSAPFSYAYIKENNSIIYTYLSEEYIPNTYTLRNYDINDNNQLQKCDLDSGLTYINVAVIYIGIISSKWDLSQKFSQTIRMVLNVYLDSFETKTKNIFFKPMIEYVDNSTNPEIVLKKFKDLNITNVFGFFYYNLLQKYLPYLEKYNMIAWYLSGIPSPSFNNNRVIPFYIPISLVSVIEKESYYAILIYSDRIYFNEYIDEIVEYLYDYTNVEVISYKSTQSDNEYIDNFIDKIIFEVMKNDEDIYLFLRADDFVEIIPQLVRTLKSAKAIKNYSITSFVDFPIVKHEYEEFDEIKFITAIDFAHQNELKNRIINIYKSYNLNDINLSDVEQYIFIALSAFISLIQKSDYNNASVVMDVFRRRKEYNDTSVFEYSLIEPSFVKRISRFEFKALFYFSSITNLLKYSNKPGYYIQHNKKSLSDDNSDYLIAIVYDRRIKSDYFIVNIAYIFQSIAGSYINGRFISIMEVICNDNGLYLSEIENKIDSIELIVCGTNSTVRDIIDEKILTVYKKVMYYLFDDKGTHCSPYIFYFGLSTQGKAKSEVGYISENCEAITMIYDNSEHSEEEIQAFKSELDYYNIQYGNIYKVFDEYSDFTDFIRIISHSTSSKECILNFLDDNNTIKLIEIFNSYSAIATGIKLVSVNLKFKEYQFPISKVDHFIINYFNPINPLPIYNNILKSLEELYSIKVHMKQLIYNAVNAVSFWKLVMKKTNSRFNSTNDFLLAHYHQLFNNGKYVLRIQENHHISHSRHVIYQKYLDAIPQVVFESDDTYTTYVNSDSSTKLCLLIDDVFYEYYTPKRKVTIGFLIPSNYNLKNVYPNYITDLASYSVVAEKIYKELGRVNIKFTYVKYRINDRNENECIKTIQSCINNKVDYVIAPLISSCVQSMVDNLNNSSIIIFATDYLIGTNCNSKLVYTAKTPNQIINPTMGYFTTFIMNTKFLHIIYNSDKISRKKLNEIVLYSLSQQGNEIIIYEYTRVSSEMVSILINIIKRPGMIITFLGSVDLGFFLSELSHYNLDKSKWKVLSLLVSHGSVIYNIPSKYLDNVYISSLYVNETKSKPILDKYFLTDHQPIYSGATEIALEYIYEMVIKNKTLKDLYGKVFHSEIVGDFQLDESNSLRYPLILTYYNNGEREIVFPSAYLFKPNPLLFSLRQEQCDFSISDEITPVKIQKVHLGFVYQKESDLVIASIIAQILNYMAFSI